MENYRNGVDEGNDLDSIDFDALVQNLEVCIWSSLFAEVIYLCKDFVLPQIFIVPKCFFAYSELLYVKVDWVFNH